MRTSIALTIAGAAVVVASLTIVLVSGVLSAPPAEAPTEEFPDGPTVAFYGDSYTLGTGASDPSQRWSTIISRDRGWNEFNPSVNGLGFVTNRGGAAGDGDILDQIIERGPDMVIVTMGLNDNFSFATRADDIEAQIPADLERLRDALPDARIIVVEPFWYTDERPESVDTIIGWVMDTAAAVDAERITGASRWIEGRPDWIAADGLHPNDEGYAAIAERMDAELQRLGL
ncbi:SGNH/GDSL hydrolase family protein [Marisediminicola senii]|uniref:SGNH/GDSL hydrolase family protein n=1 Tax=Marisediminicola senii TaxID=2711233 RepID=UPI0013EBCD99|nr:SGNH/GDSL hydrolase family protein [Marisediminicola senii]